MTLNKKKFLIIIPAYNESKNISKVLLNLKRYNVLVIDDGSIDNTMSISKKLGAKVIQNLKNMGVDYSINKGFLYALKKKYTHVITIDADGQHNPIYVKKIKKYLNNNYDLVITDRKFFPRFSEKLFSLFTRSTIGVNDLLSGLKGYNIKLFKQHGCYDSFKSIGTELSFFSIKKYNPTLKIFTIKVKKRIGKPRIGGIFLANFKILKALFFLKVRDTLI